MSLSLREERKVRTSAAIAAAALRLFDARGYAHVTVGEVAAAARVGERTLYRYFVDKEDLLFAEEEDWIALLGAAVEQPPDGEPPFDVLRRAAAVVARALEDRRDEVARRARVVSASPALTARERAKHATWEVAFANGLSRRGVPVTEASLLARVAVACSQEALARWLAPDRPRQTLTLELDAAFAELAALVAHVDARRR